MRIVYFLWLVELLLGGCTSMLLLKIYKMLNILSLYLLLFAPSLITAFLFAVLIKTKLINKMNEKYVCLYSAVFALIGTAHFIMSNIMVQYNVNILPIIIDNTRGVLSEQYLIIKENSGVLDYIMIFSFIFILFYITGYNKRDCTNE